MELSEQSSKREHMSGDAVRQRRLALGPGCDDRMCIVLSAVLLVACSSSVEEELAGVVARSHKDQRRSPPLLTLPMRQRAAAQSPAAEHNCSSRTATVGRSAR